MGHLQVAHVDYYLPDGRMLLSDASFRVGQGDVLALVGPNGAGKSTLLKIISGELKPHAGTVTTSGGLGVMPQFVGSVRDERTVRDLLVSVARPVIRDAARAVDAAELAIIHRHTIDGEMMLRQVGGLIATIGRYVRSSHEHYDGSGYPDGLAGEAIPIESRIVCVCVTTGRKAGLRPLERARCSQVSTAAPRIVSTCWWIRPCQLN